MTKAYLRPRPIRIAYLVEETEHWRAMLQEVFNDAFGRWGGRFNLIVPCSDGVIHPDYTRWLSAYDPDIIYSFVDLDDAYLARLHETFYPSFLVKHRFLRKERETHDFEPRMPVSCLHSLSVTPLISRGGPLAPSQPIPLIDCYASFKPSLFLQETFGLYNRCVGMWPIPHDLTPYVTPNTIVPPEVQSDARMLPKIVDATVSSEMEMLDRIQKQRNLVGMAQLSAALTPRLQIRTRRANQVNLVVGDSFVDRIVYWNARSLLDPHLDSSLVTLKIEQSDVDDPHRFQAIQAIIRNRVVSRSGSSNSAIAIRSASIAADQLETILEKFRSADKWNTYIAEPIESVASCVPSEPAIVKEASYTEPGASFQSSDWHEVSLGVSEFRPPKIPPRHIRDVPHVPPSVSGAWAFDIDIDRSTDYSRFQNVQHRWRLPRRLRLASAFVQGYGLGGPTGPSCIPRVTRGGLLSLFATKEGEAPELTLPSDERAFGYALCAQRNWLPFDYGRGPSTDRLVYEMRPSDKGHYLKALLRLGGGIHSSREIFLHQFWRSEFESLGASPRNGEDKIPTIIQTLKKRLKEGKISTEAHWERIGRVVAHEARQIRLAPRHLQFDELADRFEAFRNNFWSANEPTTPREEWDRDEKDSLAASVRYLCSRDILHQGYEWLCRHCKYSNWLGIDALHRTMTCEVCASEAPAPVADAWCFKLNSFVLEGLRDHGLLANLWCLDKLSEKANTSFYFLEPHELFLSAESANRHKSDAEFDLIAVVDGLVHLCEAKTSNNDIDLEKFARTARHLRPDVATLAIMEASSPAIARKDQELQRLLADDGITVETITLRGDDIRDDPHLPAGNSFSVRLL
ncbi:hypothetical protein [Bradyrhizobium nitroreducens]|uniref:hypothetical protein n=1 Tax=Bradyrhizobium nitroreducens TaxID=709803 RepID=UPI0011AEB044|nr:hypothetical protein [Bradyrhizobium nitroreducens]